MKIRQAARNRSASKLPSSPRNFIRLIDAKLHAESSMNMYSEQGLLLLIGAVFGQVCQRWIVSSYCRPGSPQSQVPSAILSIRSRARYDCMGRPVVTARRKASLARTDRLAFWNITEL